MTMRGLQQILWALSVVTVMFALSQPLQAQERPVPSPAPDSASTGYSSQTLPFDLDTATPVSGQTLLDLSGITTLTLGRKDPVSITFAIINVLLTLLGLIFLVLMVYAGAIWVLARGNEEEISRAKDMIRRALFGLVIVLSAFGASFLFFYVIGTISGEEITV